MSEAHPSNESNNARLREHPDARFADARHELDLRAVARELAETPARRGQRQKALYHHGRLTVALFTFEAGAGLAEHVTQGVVTIHVIDGRLRVQAGGNSHDLSAGKLLVLAPGVRHAVTADEPSTMLLQVYLDDVPAADKR